MLVIDAIKEDEMREETRKKHLNLLNEEEAIAEKDDGVAIKEDDAGSSSSYPHNNKSFTVIA